MNVIEDFHRNYRSWLPLDLWNTAARRHRDRKTGVFAFLREHLFFFVLPLDGLND